MCNIEPVLQADEKLKRMLQFVKIILIINFVSSFLRIFIKPSDILYDLFCTLFLFLAYNSVYFLYMAVYIIFCLINSVFLFINCATIIQMLIQQTLGDAIGRVPLYLGISLYLFIFYVFSIIFNYPVYREMKAQLMENFGGGAGSNSNRERINQDPERGVERSERPQQSSSSNNRGGFQAFSGRGQAVGSN